MEQRRLRLGDILDDYCTRERRVTNHAVVAMVEETVKQTRCTTCDAEHPYKGGHAPRRKKKETSSSLYKEVLAGKPDTDVPVHADAGEAYAAADVEAADPDAVAPAQAADDASSDDVDTEEVPQPILSRPTIAPRRDVAPEPQAPQAAVAGAAADATEEDDDRPGLAEEGPVHRQLIRAQLPRIEGQKEERRPTDFTIRQPGGRGNQPGNQFRGGNDRMRSGGRGGQAGNGFGNNPNGAGNRGNGHRPHGQRFAGARSGQGQGPGQGPSQGQGRGQGGGFRSPQQPRQGGGGRKRSR